MGISICGSVETSVYFIDHLFQNHSKIWRVNIQRLSRDIGISETFGSGMVGKDSPTRKFPGVRIEII
jgi:hypothetical protein